MKLIGVTGGVGAGKSEILSYLEKHYNCKVLKADEIAHKLYEPGAKCYEPICQLFGKDILDKKGYVDKQKVAEQIFKEKELLQKMNEIIHPAVKEYVMHTIEEVKNEKKYELFFLEAALLLEAGYTNLLDEIWYLYADEKTRQERLRVSRGYSDEKINSILQKQMSDCLFRQRCDFILDNSNTLKNTYQQIDKKLEGYLWRE